MSDDYNNENLPSYSNSTPLILKQIMAQIQREGTLPQLVIAMQGIDEVINKYRDSFWRFCIVLPGPFMMVSEVTRRLNSDDTMRNFRRAYNPDELEIKLSIAICITSWLLFILSIIAIITAATFKWFWGLVIVLLWLIILAGQIKYFSKLMQETGFVKFYYQFKELLERIEAQERELFAKIYIMPTQIAEKKAEIEKLKKTNRLEAELQEYQLETQIHLETLARTLAISKATTEEQVKVLRNNTQLDYIKAELNIKDEIEERKRRHQIVLAEIQALEKILTERMKTLVRYNEADREQGREERKDIRQTKQEIAKSLAILRGWKGKFQSLGNDAFADESIYDDYGKVVDVNFPTGGKKKVEIKLSDGSLVSFYPYPLNTPCICDKSRKVANDLSEVLLHPYEEDELLQPGKNKIFLGFAAQDPSINARFPVWLPVDKLTTHLFIGGSTGSGKTSLAIRLIAGALKSFGTVVIGEVKSGTSGFAEGAAFTELATYLGRQLNVNTYRWPRGNCWFNPLLYLENKANRDGFLDAIVRQIEFGGEMQGYVIKAAEIAGLIIEYLHMSPDMNIKRHFCTLRQLLSFMRSPNDLQDQIKEIMDFLKKQQLDKNGKDTLQKVKTLEERFNSPEGFFNLEKNKLIPTANAINAIANLLDNEDLLHYSEPNDKDIQGVIELKELKIDDILYNRSIMVVSQPLQERSSKIVGPLFWDALLSHVQQLGIGLPVNSAGKPREEVAIFLDETYRLPTGQMGDAGDYLRQYHVGLIEIAPGIKNQQRWEECKMVYQTFISLSPAIAPLVDFMHSQLPNIEEDPIQPRMSINNGSLKIGIDMNSQNSQSGKDNPGVSRRSLINTGKRTGLLMNRDIQGIFWFDFESPLLGQFDPELKASLLKDAIKGNPTAIAATDYALGLVMDFRVENQP